ncbi:MAG: hypothetical protein ABF624_00140 [Liquorilactobacillus ghanensis]|uniref:phage tail tube assembly chaperone n=1 Tax=Liquorilactobacillus ghanensis TaxID=399370 RepID=UPI0039ED92C3
MSKIVEFDGNKIGIDKQYRLLDTPRNIKKIVSHYKKLLSKIDETSDDDSATVIADYTPMLAEIVAESAADILNLNSKQKEKLEDYSFSDQYDLFNDCLAAFIGISLPSNDDEEVEEKKEDPKSQEEEQSGN